MEKPRYMGGYRSAVTDACERVLVTLLRGLGPYRDLIFLVGGLTPRYLVRARPPEIPPHAGTGDVDVMIDASLLADVDAYNSLEENLHRMGFERAEGKDGAKLSWRWQAKLETGATMILEFLSDVPGTSGGKPKALPYEGKIAALNIPHASIVVALHDQVEVTAELLDGGGLATETIRYANLVSFTCLKAFAFNDRAERKDAHDLVYCLEHAEGGMGRVLERFKDALAGQHADTIALALDLVAKRFGTDANGEGYLKDGCVAAARFELDNDDQEGDRDTRILRQRQIAETVAALISGLNSKG